LQRRTEGWIAGLQFAALSLQGRTDTSSFLTAFTGSHCFVLDYLYANTVQIRRKGGKEDKEAGPLAYLSQETVQERTCLMRLTIPENGEDDKVCHQIDLGMLLRA
jgi:hypothetical protein